MFMVPATALVIGVVTAAAAQAHVIVTADDARHGAPSALLRFTVPNESRTASTVAVRITLPATLGGPVSPRPPAGWTASTTAATGRRGAVVTFTAADGAGLRGEYGQAVFGIRIGVLPRTGTTLTFAAAQVFDDGRTVTWDDPPLPGDAEPAHPAPSLRLAGTAPKQATPPASPASASASVSPSVSGAPGVPVTVAAGPVVASAAPAVPAATDDATGRQIGAALVLAAGLAGAVTLLARGRRQRPGDRP